MNKIKFFLTFSILLLASSCALPLGQVEGTSGTRLGQHPVPG